MSVYKRDKLMKTSKAKNKKIKNQSYWVVTYVKINYSGKNGYVKKTREPSK